MSIGGLLIKDSSGKPSVTMTAFVTGFLVVNAKLLLSGITIVGFKMAAFTGGEYAAALSALGAIYVMRRNFGNTEEALKETNKK